MQERAVEEVKLAIKPFYQKREITKEEYKDILRKAVQKVGIVELLCFLLRVGCDSVCERERRKVSEQV